MKFFCCFLVVLYKFSGLADDVVFGYAHEIMEQVIGNVVNGEHCGIFPERCADLRGDFLEECCKVNQFTVELCCDAL